MFVKGPGADAAHMYCAMHATQAPLLKLALKCCLSCHATATATATAMPGVPAVTKAWLSSCLHAVQLTLNGAAGSWSCTGMRKAHAGC
jgi:hypothetical protein